MKLDPWQQEVLDINGDVLLCTGRRVGKTYIMARKAIDRMIKKKTPIIVVSLTEDQAYIIIIMAMNYLKERYPKIAKKTKSTLRQITLPNNSMMISRPVGDKGDGARGFEGGVLMVDEASRMPKLFWIAAKPILLTTNGEIWMCSTPFGKQGYFWDKFNETYNLKKEGARFKVFYKTSEEVIEDREISESWTKEQRMGALRILKEDKEEMSDLEYGQEYLGLFLDELRQFYSDELIKSCQTLKRQNSPKIHGHYDYYLGVDIARMGADESTFEIIRKIDMDNYVQEDNIVTKHTLTTKTTEMILTLEDTYHFKQIFIDDGGMGVGVLDQLLTDERTRRKTIAINNSSRPLDREEKKKRRMVKEDLYKNLLSLMERKQIKLLNDNNIFLSLKSVQYEFEDKGKMRIFGKYKHIADGLIRAAYCAKDKTLNIWTV